MTKDTGKLLGFDEREPQKRLEVPLEMAYSNIARAGQSQKHKLY